MVCLAHESLHFVDRARSSPNLASVVFAAPALMTASGPITEVHERSLLEMHDSVQRAWLRASWAG
jgi:hypothetical protein